MNTQIAVRLPEDLVAFMDDEVASGGASSRAAMVTRALEQERRRRTAERDARIYAERSDPDLVALAAWSATQPIGSE